ELHARRDAGCEDRPPVAAAGAPRGDRGGRPGRGDQAPARLNERAAARKVSFSSGVPMVTLAPSPTNGRTTTLLASACSAKAAVCSPSGSQTKFAWVSGTS